MNTCTLALYIGLFVSLTVVQAHRPPGCPGEQCQGKGVPFSTQEMVQLSLQPKSECGWQSSAPGFRCTNQCDKSYYRCNQCSEIFSTNTDYADRDKQPCSSHRHKAFVTLSPQNNPSPSDPKPFLYHFL
ncbi:hypothetical protein PGT21_007707 [Puccinia graminis f. sp. tritici]|uniref:Uncharacterized protein n=1 Tax=Puccinia graminis f. sp. tritici TaxID=56615 RepID=A0A5B0MN41_PUCGR|nr:hypothetical protein PGT21_007707 [Puccinia graminis f. sp. tritici]